MSIRSRLALVFTVAAALVFALGGWLFVTELSSSLLASTDSQLSTRLAQADRYLSSRGNTSTGSGDRLPGEFVVQLVDPADRVRGGSAEASEGRLLGAADIRRARHMRIVRTVSAEGERERVIAAPLPRHPGWVAVVGVSLDSVDRTLGDVTRELLIAGGVFVAAAGIGSYTIARAALSPVERMRREVAALSEHGPARGVRVPRTRDELAALAITMNELLDRLDHALTRQRALVADAAHELRTPFAILLGELELAGRPGRSQQDLEVAIADAADEVSRLAHITEQLLFLARSDEDRVATQRERVNVHALLARSADHLAGRADAADVAIRVAAPEDLVADVDSDRIREAVDNLVDNALRFAPAGTAVDLHAEPVGSDLLIEVADAGPGFPPDFLPHAFERFARPEPTPGGGAGLGLAIVSAIAGAHGGKARAANRPEGGAVVTLELPDAVRTTDLS